MGRASAWWGKTGLQLRLHILIQGCLIVILVAAQLWLANLFERQSLIAAEERAKAVADGTINGLNTLMITKVGKDEVISDKQARMQFIEKMGKSEKVKEMRVIRAKQLDTEFPGGLPQEYPVDDMDRRVLASGKAEYKMITSDEGEALLRTVVPFIAMKEFRSIKCLECHNVAEGVVLGAASITLDVKDDLAGIRNVNALIWFGQGVLQIILYIMIRWVVGRLLKQLGSEPVVAVRIAERIAEGDLTPVTVKQAPLGSLLASVERTRGQLVQVNELNDTLEKRVAERTTELEAALRRLHDSQEELIRSEAKATLSTLAASVTHELNTPISNSILAASSLAERGREVMRMLADGTIKRSQLNGFLGDIDNGTEIIGKNLKRAGELLASFRQVAADQASEQRRRFDLAGVVQETVITLSPTLKHKPHRIILNIPPGIIMDSLPGPLGQVVINLINNAYLHGFEGRTDGVINISATTSDDRVVLGFADNGVGIPEENLAKLFEPFFSTKIGQGGTGLGMAIVKNIVTETLGGEITVHSTVGAGTYVEIHLPPVVPEAVRTTPSSRNESPDSRT